MRRALRTGALALILTALGVPSPASAVLTVYLEPESTTVSVGQEFDVQLMVNDEADTISNFRVVIQFDPDIIELVSAEEGSLYVSAGYESFFHVEEESLGSWEIFEVIFPYTSFVLAPGELAVIHFSALADGETPIDFLSQVVMDIDRMEIQPIAAIGGHVTVSPGVGVEGPDAWRGGWMFGFPYPNPSRGVSSVRLARPTDPRGEDCRLSVYDPRGRLVRALDLPTAGHSSDVVWDGRNEQAIEVPSGIYFLRLDTPNETLHRKVILVR
jgi:hypothetical protein